MAFARKECSGMKERRQKNKSLTHTLVACFLVIAVFFAAYAVIYRRNQISLTRRTVSQVQAHMDQGKAEIKATVQNIISQTANLKMDSSVALMGSLSSLSSENYSQLHTLSKRLTEILPKTRIVDTCLTRLILLFDTEAPFACSNTGIYHDLSLANDSGGLGIAGKSTEEFLQIIRSGVTTQYSPGITEIYAVKTDGKIKNASFFIRKVRSSAASSVYLLLQLDVDALFDVLLMGSSLGEPAALYCGEKMIMNALPGGMEAGYDGRKNLTGLEANLDELGVRALVQISDESIFEQIEEFTLLFYLLLFLFVALLMVIIGVGVSSLIYPMQRMKKKMQQHGHSSFNTFESEFQHISENLSILRPALRTSLLDKLFHHHYLTPAERAALRSLPDLALKGDCRVIVVGALEAQTENYMEPLLQQFFGESMIHPVSQDQYAVLHPLSAARPSEETEEEMKQVLYALQEKNPHIQYAIGVSSVVSGVDLIHAGYEEAHAAFKEQWSWNQSGVRVYEKTAESAAYHVTLEELDRMHRLLHAGADEEAGKFFDALVEREFGPELQACRDPMVFSQFFSDIRGVLLRLSGQHDLSAIRLSLAESLENQQFAHLLAVYRHALHYAASMAGGKEEESENDLAQSIRLHLQENYADPCLSLGSLAELFDMSESSMSRFFKAHMGENFSSYLEKIRLSEAETLLSSSQLPVKDIASMVGYTTPATFYKAFRRKWGVSPTTHRDQ